MPDPLEKRLERLEWEMQQVHERLDRIERTLAAGMEEQREGPHPSGEKGQTSPSGSFEALLQPLAAICFALAGAFLLRVLSQRGLLSVRHGAMAGMGYCLLLLAVPTLIRIRQGIAAALAGSGIVVALSLLVETTLRWHAFSAAEAAIAMASTGLAGCIPAARLKSRTLQAISLAASVVAIAALGPTLDAIAHRAWAWSALGVAAFAVSAKTGWRPLRPIVVPAVMLLVAICVLATARREEVSAWIRYATISSAAFLWLAVVVYHSVLFGRLGRGESAWLPLVTAWLVALLGFFDASVAGAAALSGGSAVMLAYVAASTKTRATGSPASQGLCIAALVAAAAGGWLVDPTAGTAGAAILLGGWCAARTRSAPLFLVSEFLLVFSVVVGSAAGHLWSAGGSPLHVLSALVLSASAAGLGWFRAAGTPRKFNVAAFVPMVVSSVALIAAGRQALVFLVDQAATMQLAASGLLAVLCTLCFYVAQRATSANWFWLGILLLIVLGAKTLFWDAAAEEAVGAAASAATLGATILVVSIFWRRYRMRQVKGNGS